ncbi:MAG: RiPP maturation radical SAM C-methyltransferase, partial [Limisphaerales bacterium]
MKAAPKVVLVSMPWAQVGVPSIALGILAAICHEEHVPVATLYPNMDLVAMMGIQRAQAMGEALETTGLTEHLFACDLFDAQTLNSDRFIEELMPGLPEDWQKLFEIPFVKRLRDEMIPAFLKATLKRILGEKPKVVGFTAPYVQVMASLALARGLKEARADLQILAGGASFDSEVGQEYHRALPGILDHVFIGEAEESFREYLRRLSAGKPTRGIAGVTYLANGRVRLIPKQQLMDLNQSPVPDYDGYFLETERILRETDIKIPFKCLPIEGSRGCWWGQKSRCLFCGVPGESMRFSEKDAVRVISEILSLSVKYHVLKFHAADLIISRTSRGAIFKKLKELDLGIELFFETRFDLSKEEIALMRDAKVHQIQPGIESLSTE